MIALYRNQQESTAKNSPLTAIPPKTVHTDTNCHQQSPVFDGRTSAVNGSPVPKHNYKATALNSDEVKKSTECSQPLNIFTDIL